MTDLRDRLAAIDPATDLPPLDAGARAVLLERATASSAPPRLRRRLRLPLLVVGGLAAAALAGVLLIPRPPAGPVLALEVSAADPTQLCAPLADFAPQALAGVEVAFVGVVTAADGTIVEIRPERFYRGGPASAVRLGTTSGGGPALDGPVLREGERVLIAATGGQVAGCGLSGPASPALQQYYDAAFSTDS